MSDPVIELHSVGKTYRSGDLEVEALRGVDLTIRRGEFVAIMGASGSGKSTLMNILGCLDSPSIGSYRLDGTDLAQLDEPSLARIRSRRIGFVFQSFNLLARTTAAENVALPLYYAGQVADSAERAAEALSLVGLADRARNHPNQLSGGQQQRVALARALINDPAILLADEPTGNLDSQTAGEIMRILRELNRQRGLTIILVTHERSMALFADRIISLSDGEVVSDQALTADGPPAEWTAASGGGAEPASAGGLGALAHLALIAAWRSIGRNKLRSALTMLGVFIGVAALIAMLAVGEGARAAVRTQMESLGTDLIIVLPGTTRTNGVRGGTGSASSLTVADAGAILEEDPAVGDLSYVNRQSAEAVYGSESWSTSVQGVTPSYLPIRNWPVAEGRAFTADDEHDGRTVCLLGQTVVDSLFGENQDPVGATVIIKNVTMEVIGVLAAKGHSAGGQDQDDVVLIPFSTSQERVLGVVTPVALTQSKILAPQISPANPFGIEPKLEGFVQTMYVQARSPDLVQAAVQQVTETLEHRHRIREDQDDDFRVRDLTEIAAVAENSSRVMELLLAAIASISLVVGGIGIMNILLVSVTERTREIGIRMAIGARRAHVLVQFLVEAMTLSLMGGGAGVGAGIVASQVISVVAGWPTRLEPDVAVAAFAFSAAVGIFFGYYPARLASRLNPIDALRYE